MTQELKGSRALVFGGTSGIGLASARALAASGAAVGVVGSTAGNLEAALKALPDGSRGFAVDAADGAAIAGALADFGAFDHLVVCVGGGSAIGPYRDLTEEKMRAGFDNKFWHYQRITRAALAHLRGAGSITWVTGAAARLAIRGMAGLAATNGALHAMVGPLALELAPLRVNAVSPGFIDTPYWRKAMPEAAREKLYADMAAVVPVRRVGTAEDVAGAVVMLAANGFFTGAILDCDGGRHLGA
ncbi:MAG: SDR family oxidoreductase [Burkholderiales bacterium]|nr:SDR family oxidoreductase [Burkholderiales bacterium]